MKRTILLLFAVVLCGCTGPRHVSPAEFQNQYAAVGQPDTMRNVVYLGQRDERAYLQVSTMSTVGRKWNDQVIYAELADLDPTFRDLLPKMGVNTAH